MTERLCVFCKRLRYEQVETWQSDSDSGLRGGFDCEKRHFPWPGFIPETLEEFRRLILLAEGCKDYATNAGKKEIDIT